MTSSRYHSIWREVLWLEGRHLRTTVNRALSLAGADLEDSKGYLVYLAAILIAWAISSWAMLSAGVASRLAQLGSAELSLLMELIEALPLAFTAIAAVRGLHRSSLLLSKADTTFLTGSSCALRVTYTFHALGRAILSLAGSAFVLSLFGGGMSAVMPRLCWGCITFLLSSAFPLGSLIGSALGLMRLTGNPQRPVWHIASFGIGTVGAVFLGYHFSHTVGIPLLLLAVEPVSAIAVGVAFLLLSCLVIIWLLSTKREIDVRVIVEESALFAELQAYDPFLSPTATAERRRILRNHKAAQREKRGLFPMPSASLPIGHRRMALLSHAVISGVRRPGYVGDALIWSAIVVPSGIAIMALPVNKGLLIPWLALCLACLSYARELCHVFFADTEDVLIDPIPVYELLTTLTLDSLPSLILAVLASVGVTLPVLLTANGNLGWILVGVLLDIGIVVSCGLSSVSLPPLYARIPYEISGFVVALVAALTSLAGLEVTLVCLAVLLAIGAALLASVGGPSQRACCSQRSLCS